MPGVRVTIESDLGSEWSKTCGDFVRELRPVVDKACKDGAKHAQEHHPYQDHTYHLTDTVDGKVESTDAHGAEGSITWPQEYASFVDEGTSRSAAYPFADEAEKVAEAELERGVRELVARTESRMR